MDWAGLMRVAFKVAGLSPDAFWKLTPAEFLVTLGLEASSPPLTRARLGELARAYPDVNKGKTNGL